MISIMELRHVDGTMLTSSWSNRVGKHKKPGKCARYAAESAEIHQFIDGEFTVYINNEEIGTFDTVARAARVIECRVIQYI